MAQTQDLDILVALSAQKRQQYVGHAPVFHRPARNAAEVHRPWLARLIADDSVAALVHVSEGEVVDGFLVATLVAAPPVYDPGGLTCSIDDFAVAYESLWTTSGRALLASAQEWGRGQGAVQTVVVCGASDRPKRQMLRASGLDVVSEWYTAPLNTGRPGSSGTSG